MAKSTALTKWKPSSEREPILKVEGTRIEFTPSIGISVGAAAALGAGGWIAFRYYVRSRLRKEMAAEGYDTFYYQSQGVAGLFSLDLNLPPPEALVESMVPLLSGVMPDTAYKDILLLGRQSRYWPEKYRQGSSLPALFEKGAMAFLRVQEASGA